MGGLSTTTDIPPALEAAEIHRRRLRFVALSEPVLVGIDEASNQSIERKPLGDELPVMRQPRRIGIAFQDQTVRIEHVVVGRAIVGEKGVGSRFRDAVENDSRPLFRTTQKPEEAHSYGSVNALKT